MDCLGFGVKRSKVKFQHDQLTTWTSGQRHTEFDAVASNFNHLVLDEYHCDILC